MVRLSMVAYQEIFSGKRPLRAVAGRRWGLAALVFALLGSPLAWAEDWGYDALDLAGGGYSGDFTRKTYTASYIWYQVIKTSNPAATGDQWHKFNDNGSWTKQWGEYTGFTLTPNNDVQFNGSIDAGGSGWGWGDPASFNINLENSKSYVINVFNDDDIIGGPGNDACGVAVVEVNHQSGLMSLGTPVTSNDATYCYLNANNSSAEAASSVEEVWFQWTTNNFGTKNYVEIIDLPAYTTLRLAMTTDIKPGAQLKWLAMTTANISTATVVSTTSGVGNFDAAAINKTDVQTYWVKPPYSAWEIVDEFMYDEGGQLNAKSGGFGWTNGNTWVESSAGAYTISAGSFGNVTGYPTNLGNKVVVTPGAGQSLTAYRTFPTVNTGVIFAAAFVNHTTGGADRWMGLSFCSNGTERAFFGELSGQDQKLGLGSYDAGSSETASGYSLTAGSGSDYIIIGKYDFQTKQFSTKGYYKTDTIPSVQPAAWDATTTLAADRIISLNGIRLGAGGASSPGACYFDEVRVARNWSDLMNKAEPNWKGLGATFEWENITNWAGNAVPASSAVAVFGDSFVNGTTVSNTAAVTVAGLRFNDYADGNLLFTNRSVTPAMTINGAGIAVSSGSGGTHALAIQRINLGADQNWTNESAQTLTFNTQLRSTGNVTKQGSGRIALTYQANASDFSGTLTVNNGPLQIAKASALGAVSAGTTVAAGSALELAPASGTAFDPEPLTLSGGGISEGGALRSISGNNTYAGPITLAATARINADANTLTITNGINGSVAGKSLVVGGAGNITVTTVAIGSNVDTLSKDGAGTFTLSIASTYSGATIVSNGTFTLGADNVVPDTSAVVLQNGATFNCANDTVASVAGTGTLAVGTATFTMTGTNVTNYSFGGLITGTSGRFVKKGICTLILTNRNTLGNGATGGITVEDGQLSVPVVEAAGTAQPLGDSTAADALILGSAGKYANFTYTGPSAATTKPITLAADGTGLVWVANTAAELTLSGVISGSGTLRSHGVGICTLSASNTYGGRTLVTSGPLKLGAADRIPDTSAVTVGPWGTLVVNYNETVASIAGDGIISNLDASVTLTVGGDNTSTAFNGPIVGGAGRLAKTGTGTLTLTNDNTWGTTAGGITIAEGTVSVPRLPAKTTAQPLGDSSAADAIILGSAGKKGTLQFTGAGAVSTKDVTLATDGTGVIEVATSAAMLTNSGVFAGSGGLVKTGAGKLILSGASTHSGATRVSAGILVQNGTHASSAATVDSGTFLYGAGSFANLTANGTVSPGSDSNTVGALAVAALNLENSGRMQVEITTMGGAAGTGYDTINASGACTVNAADGSDFVIEVRGTPADFDSAKGYTNTVISAASGSGFATNKFTLNIAGFTPDLRGGVFAISESGGSIRLVFTPALAAPASPWAWNGLGANDKWSTGANWTNTIAPVSANSNDLIFAGTTRLANTNDIAAPFSLRTLRFASGAGAFTLNGSALTLYGGITNESASQQTITNSITLGAHSTWEAAAGNLAITGPVNAAGFNLQMGGAYTTVLYKALAGAGDLLKTNAGTLVLAADNTFSGVTRVAGGMLEATATNALMNMTNVVVANGGTLVTTNLWGGGLFRGGVSNRSILVTGAGSTWTNKAHITTIGQSGVGNSLTISNGGLARSVNAYIGNDASSTGNVVTVTGAGSIWTNSSLLFVGNFGSFNFMTISAGGRVVDASAYIGQTGSTGNMVTVTGAGSMWTNTLMLNIAGSFDTLVITNSGGVYSGQGSIGYSVKSFGNLVKVTGAGSLWQTPNLYVGESGTSNTLIISDGGQVGGGASIGGQASATGNAAVVTGSGSSWMSGSTMFYVGYYGQQNSLTIRDGGQILDNNGILGWHTSAVCNAATVTGTGSLWTNSGYIMVGNYGSFNTLTITNGGNVISSSGYIGYQSGGNTNTVTVVGAGSVWSNIGGLVVGYSSANTLTIRDGGVVYNGQDGLVGGNGEYNVATVSGTNSLWRNKTALYVGNYGAHHTLVVSNGGRVVNSVGYIGREAAATDNLVVVTGAGSVWSNSAALYVGYAGVGSRLTVANGGLVVATGICVGETNSSIANAVLVQGGTLTTPGGYDIRRGTNTLESGGLIDTRVLLMTNAASAFILNAGTLNTRTAHVANGQAFVVGGGQSAATYNLAVGGHLFVDGLQVNTSATLYANGLILPPSGDVTIYNGGTLAGTGRIQRLATLQGGAWLHPGTNASHTDTLTLSNLTVNSGATYLFQCSVGVTDRVAVLGALTFASTPVVTVKLDKVSGAFASQNVLFSYDTLAGDPQWEINYGNSGLTGAVITNIAASKQIQLVIRNMTVDGNDNDWVGTPPTVVNSSTISSKEFIIKDKHWESREDSDHDDDVDLTEFRVYADATDLYILARFSDITDIAYPYLAIAVDTDRAGGDGALNWMADDSGTTIGGDYNDAANAHYPERNLIVHTVNGVGQRMELYADDGSAWYSPPTYGNDQCNFSAANNLMEIKIARSDLGLTGSVTGRFTVAAYHAMVPCGWANDGDTTAGYATQDAQDALNLLKFSYDDGAGDASAWDEELSDGDIDSWFDVALNASGIVDDSLPTAPANLAVRTNALGNVESTDGNVLFTWDRSTDANDKVTSYLVEFNNGALAENAAITHRENFTSNTFYYLDTTELIGQADGSYNFRVRARDAQGALSAASDLSFTLSSTDDDIAGPTPTLVYLGTSNYNGKASNTMITDAELANPGNLIDFAIGWTDPSGVFLTNRNQLCNIGSPDGRVTPNWEVWYSLGSVTNNVAGTPENNMFSNRVVGFNGALSATTYQNNAFTIGDFDTNNTYYITISAEDEDNDRGTYADSVTGVGDDLAYDRTVRTNYLLTFLTAAQVIDDDPNPPDLTSFRFNGALTLTDGGLAAGLVITGLVQDSYSGIWGTASRSNRYALYNPAGTVISNLDVLDSCDAIANQGALAAALPIGKNGVRIPYAANMLGTWTARVYSLDYDQDRVNDAALAVSNFTFEVTDDDTVTPEYLTMTYGGLGSAYLVVATNTAADGAITERDGSSTNRVFWVTDEYLAHLAGAPLYFAFGCRDAASGISSGNSASTNQVSSFRLQNFATEATLLSSETTIPRWQAGLSSADGVNQAVTNVWSFADQAQFTAGVIDNLYNASTSKVVAMLVDGDNDRTNDRAALASAQVGILGVYDEDTNTPVLLSFRVNGPVSAPGLALLDGEMTNAISMTGMVRDVNGVYGTGSGFAPRYSLYSPLGLVSNNDLLDGFNISNGDGTGTNFHYGKHQVRAWYEMNTLGTWTCRVTFADYDTDRTGDSAVGVSNFAFSVSDDDVRGPAMKGLDVVAMPELIHCDFFTDWDQHSEGDWSDTDANGTWYGYGMYANVGTSSDGDGRRAGFNTAGDYLVLPPKDYPGQLTLSAYLSGAGAETISVERANGAAWTRIAEMEVNNSDSYDSYAFQIYDTNTAVTLRVYCVTRDARSIYFDDVRVDGIATWTNLASLDVTFLAARDPGNSGVYEYRRTALDDPEPTGLGDGSTLGTGTNFTLAGGGLPEGIHTGYLFAVDNDVDRANDRTKGANTRYVVKIDRTPPGQPGNFGLMAAGYDDESEAGLEWDAVAHDNLAPWHSYRVYWNYGDHSVAITDQYFDVTQYPGLGARTTNAAIITNLLSGQEYRFAIAGLDAAGNHGGFSSETNILIGFLTVTQGVQTSATKLRLNWTGATAAKTYDVIHKDSTTYSDAYTNYAEWTLLGRTNVPAFIDHNPAAMGDNLRFYRVSYLDRWNNGQRKKASSQVYVGKRIRLYSGRNWVSLPGIPDINTVDYVFGTSLPRDTVPANATRISWMGQGYNAWAATQQVYLANDGWRYNLGGTGLSGQLATNASLPDNQSFIVDIPGQGLATQVFFVGQLPPTNHQPLVSILGGQSSTNRAYTFFTFNSPAHVDTNLLNSLRAAGFGAWRGSAPLSDAIWTYNRASQKNGWQIFFKDNRWQYFDGAWKNYYSGMLKADDGVVVRSVTNKIPYNWKPPRWYHNPGLDLN